MKKIIKVMLGVLVMGMSLVACSGNSTKQSSSDQPVEQQGQPDEADRKIAELMMKGQMDGKTDTVALAEALRLNDSIFKKNKDNSIVLNRQVMILSLMGKVREAFDFQERAMKHDENDILWIYFKLQSSYAKGENDSARYYAGKGYDLLAAKAAKASKDERGPLLIEQISYAMFLKDKEKINKLAKAIEDETGYQMSADIDQQTEMQFRILNALKKSYETGCPLETPITTAQPEAAPDAGKQ